MLCVCVCVKQLYTMQATSSRSSVFFLFQALVKKAFRLEIPLEWSVLTGGFLEVDVFSSDDEQSARVNLEDAAVFPELVQVKRPPRRVL